MTASVSSTSLLIIIIINIIIVNQSHELFLLILGDAVPEVNADCQSQTCSRVGACVSNSILPVVYCQCVNGANRSKVNICRPCPVSTQFNPVSELCDIVIRNK